MAHSVRRFNHSNDLQVFCVIFQTLKRLLIPSVDKFIKEKNFHNGRLKFYQLSSKLPTFIKVNDFKKHCKCSCIFEFTHHDHKRESYPNMHAFGETVLCFILVRSSFLTCACWERRGRKIISFLTVMFTVRKTFKCRLKIGRLFKLLPPVSFDKVRYSF